MKKQEAALPETTYKEKEVIKVVPVVITEKDSEETARLKVKSDSLALLQKQINAAQNRKIEQNDTVYIENEVIRTIPVITSDKATLARLEEQNDSLALLKRNQINASKNGKERTADTVFLVKEVIKTVR